MSENANIEDATSDPKAPGDPSGGSGLGATPCYVSPCKPANDSGSSTCSLLVLPSNPRPKSDWHVVIEVDHQSFVLAYTAEDKQDANWMASMLQIALEKCGTRISPANAESSHARNER